MNYPRPLVFTNGVFDILHLGHIRYLAEARKLGASLVVGVNSDRSARALEKGPGRPINREQDRLELVASLRCVDHAVLFDQITPAVLLKELRPDVYVKGGDYDAESLPETPLVRSWGGKVLTLPYVPGYSTTELVERIRG